MNIRSGKLRRGSLAAASALALVIVLSFPGTGAGAAGAGPRGIVLMIGDGMGVSHLTAAFVRGGGLEIERMTTCGLVRTFPAAGLVTDSAASATAYATGHSTLNGMISIAPDGDTLRTVLELAEEIGMRTGLVATSSLTHATPAAFASHVGSRSSEDEIAGQIAASGVDLLIGGGRGWFVPAGSSGSRRKDGIDLIPLLEKGAGLAGSLEELAEMRDEGRGVLFLADGHCPPVSGREHTLARLTSVALEVLSGKGPGFFLMVEGSQIDWEAHDGDADGVAAETLDFDRAVGAALDFAEADGKTLVIVTSDHETGGFSVLDGSLERGSVDETVFGTDGHTASMVPVFAGGPGSSRFAGMMDNTRIGAILIDLVEEIGRGRGCPRSTLR